MPFKSSFQKLHNFHDEYRNEFEISRIWDEISLGLLFKMIEKSDQNLELRGAILQILTERAEEVSSILNSFGLEHEQHRLKESLDMLKKRYTERIIMQNELVNKYIEGKKEREFYFMELMVEMMDTAERLSKNKERGE